MKTTNVVLNVVGGVTHLCLNLPPLCLKRSTRSESPGDIGQEMDPFFQYQEDPETWARARLFGAPSSTILSYYLGLKGWVVVKGMS